MHKAMSNPTNIPTPQTFHAEMLIDPTMFDRMMDEEQYKNYIKERLAMDLAKQLLESKRTTFTYSKDNGSDKYCVRVKVIL